MTTIAYRDGVMASDSCWTYNSQVISNTSKVYRLCSGAVLGTCGHADDRAFVQRLTNVRAPDQLPSQQELVTMGLDIGGLLIFPDGSIWDIGVDYKEGKLEEAAVIPIIYPFYAIGSGRRFAMGAMSMDAPAEKAVEVACQHDINSRPPVHLTHLKPE